MLGSFIWAPSSLPIPQSRMLLPSSLGSILADKHLSSGCFCPHCWAPSSLLNIAVQDASVLTAGLHPHCQISHTAGLHPHCQIPQFRMLLPSLLGSILATKYLSSGCFCSPSWLHPDCQIPQFRMLLLSTWAPSSLPNTSVQDASALHLGPILTAKYLSSGCFCIPSGLHPHCQIPQFRMLLPSIWAPYSLPNTSVQDASARRMKSNHCLYIAKDIECIVKFLFRSDDGFLYPLKRLILNCCYILFKGQL